MADPLPEVIATQAADTVTETGHGGAPTHVEPELFGLAPFQIVALAMLVLILIMLWKRVPAMITRGIDGKIAAIRLQLDEAKALRAEAEQLRAEYAAKLAGAEADAGDEPRPARSATRATVTTTSSSTATTAPTTRRMR